MVGAAGGDGGRLALLPCNAAASFEQYINGLGAVVPVIKPYPPIRKLTDRGWSGTEGAVPAGGQHDGIAGSPEAPVEYEIIAIQSIAHGCGVCLGDAQPQTLSCLHGLKRDDHDSRNLRHRLADVDLRGCELRSAHLEDFQLLS